MNSRFTFFSICIFLLLTIIFAHPAYAKENSFGLRWQFAVNLPQAGISGKLKGYIEHLQGTKFRFSGKYINEDGPIKSGPVTIDTRFDMADGLLKLERIKINIRALGIKIPQLGLNTPDLTLTGSGIIDPASGAVNLSKLRINAGQLPEINASLIYSPEKSGHCLLRIDNPLPLLERIAELNIPGFEKWDRSGQFSLDVALRNIQSSPEADLSLKFSALSASSPDGMALVDSMAGSITINHPFEKNGSTLTINIKSGEALYETFYVNFGAHPLFSEIKFPLPDSNGNMNITAHTEWKGMGILKASADLRSIFDDLHFSGTSTLRTDELATPFRTFAIDPFSLEGLDGSGKFSMHCKFDGNRTRTHLKGKMNFENCTVSKDKAVFEGINAGLPFVLSLNEKFLPQTDKTLPYSQSGTIRIKKITAGELKVRNFDFPVSVSSNSIEFGTIPVIHLEGGTLKLLSLKMRNPFDDNFVLNGKVVARNINLLPLSPKSLPVDGQISGDLKFWLLKDHLSTTGKLFGKVYGGEMKIDEIFAENPFENSRQYGADFKIKHLDLEPLSQALDIGRITGRMDLDLTGLIIAYDQPAAVHLLARTTPGSGKSGDISLKAVNTLSVIGTGSGLTGAGVGMFSQFFKEFGYAGLGLECTLDADIFKIRGLIRDDGIEYIIKRPPLFGINVVNSNPENLISFSDMLKRLKRVIGN